jgi:hypothetical protein
MVNIKVFVSSDMKELDSERQAIIETIQSLGKSPIFFEAFPASPDAPKAVYLREVAETDIFIQVIGRSVSNPVKEEYEAAYTRIPGKSWCSSRTSHTICLRRTKSRRSRGATRTRGSAHSKKRRPRAV